MPPMMNAAIHAVCHSHRLRSVCSARGGRASPGAAGPRSSRPWWSAGRGPRGARSARSEVSVVTRRGAPSVRVGLNVSPSRGGRARRRRGRAEAGAASPDDRARALVVAAQPSAAHTLRRQGHAGTGPRLRAWRTSTRRPASASIRRRGTPSRRPTNGAGPTPRGSTPTAAGPVPCSTSRGPSWRPRSAPGRTRSASPPRAPRPTSSASSECSAGGRAPAAAPTSWSTPSSTRASSALPRGRRATPAGRVTPVGRSTGSAASSEVDVEAALRAGRDRARVRPVREPRGRHAPAGRPGRRDLRRGGRPAAGRRRPVHRSRGARARRLVGADRERPQVGRTRRCRRPRGPARTPAGARRCPATSASRGRVAGFENVPAIVAAAAALEAVRADADAEDARLPRSSTRSAPRSRAPCPTSRSSATPTDRLPHVVTFSCLYVDGEALVDRARPRGVRHHLRLVVHGEHPRAVARPGRDGRADPRQRARLAPARHRPTPTSTVSSTCCPASSRTCGPTPGWPTCEPTVRDDADVEVDARGRLCPLPVIDLARAARHAAAGRPDRPRRRRPRRRERRRRLVRHARPHPGLLRPLRHARHGPDATVYRVRTPPRLARLRPAAVERRGRSSAAASSATKRAVAERACGRGDLETRRQVRVALRRGGQVLGPRHLDDAERGQVLGRPTGRRAAGARSPSARSRSTSATSATFEASRPRWNIDSPANSPPIATPYSPPASSPSRQASTLCAQPSSVQLDVRGARPSGVIQPARAAGRRTRRRPSSKAVSTRIS